MTIHYNDPSGMGIGGEVATIDECERLDALASSLVVDISPSRIRTYGHELIEHAKLEFQTMEYEENGVKFFEASVAVYDDRDDFPQLELIVDGDNKLLEGDYPYEEQRLEVASLIGELIGTDELDERELAMARHLLKIVFQLIDDEEPENVNQITNYGSNSATILSMVREIIAAADPPIMEMRQYLHPISNSQVLSVTEYRLPNGTDPVIMHEYDDDPRLEIISEYTDPHMKYDYAVTFGGDRDFEAYNPTQCLNHILNGGELTKKIVNDGTDEHSSSLPPRVAIELLTEDVISATEQELTDGAIENITAYLVANDD